MRLLTFALTLAYCAAVSYTVTHKGKRIPLTSASPLALSAIHKALLPTHPHLAASDLVISSNGSPLTDDDKTLEEMGVADGATITVRIRGEKKKPKSPSTATTSPPPAAFGGLDDLLAKATSGNGGDMAGTMAELQKLATSLPGLGDKPPSSPKEALQMMKTVLASPIVSAFLADPAKLELARQAVLGNPMIKAMLIQTLPGFDAILNDKDTWAMTLAQAKDMYLNMGEAEMEMMATMMKQQAGSMGGEMGGGMGNMGGLGDFDMSELDGKVDELDE